MILVHLFYCQLQLGFPSFGLSSGFLIFHSLISALPSVAQHYLASGLSCHAAGLLLPVCGTGAGGGGGGLDEGSVGLGPWGVFARPVGSGSWDNIPLLSMIAVTVS